MDPNLLTNNISASIGAAAALGTAAFALVDAAKIFGGPSLIGFGYIRGVVTRFLPAGSHAVNAMSTRGVLETLRGNWINGTALADQKAIAKSLIKLRLTPAAAGDLATAAGVDKVLLTSALTKQAAGKPMLQAEQDVFGRFDLILTAALDGAYQQADQAYRNWSRVLAILVAVLLALAGGFFSFHNARPDTGISDYLRDDSFWKAGLIGLIATPIAPIAKDLTSGLAASIKLAQAWTK